MACACGRRDAVGQTHWFSLQFQGRHLFSTGLTRDLGAVEWAHERKRGSSCLSKRTTKR